MSEWTAETAEWYAKKYGEYPTNRLTVEHLELAPDAVVLDVGCGTAAALRHAATKVTTGSLIGVDPVPRMVEIAKERLASHPCFGTDPTARSAGPRAPRRRRVCRCRARARLLRPLGRPST
ncbi:MAG: class I SAM-dependent methyltransferase [Deltaproteobacteria bacterium]|nr:class I SAM-dependent methyltransferase [Deltaproteobacteria bacterium]